MRAPRVALWVPFAIALSVCANLGGPGAVSAQDAQGAQDVVEQLGTEGASVAIVTPNQGVRGQSTFVTLSTGGLVFVRGQRFVVTSEPPPSVVITEPPPAPPVDAILNPTETTIAGAIWVPGYWTHGADGFVWVEGRHIAPKPGHVFVPPRWVLIQERYLFFNGFFVPHRVWVRSFFNTYHYSGDPVRNRSATRDRGPYWPIGVSGRPVGTSTTRGRGPYWPLGLGPPTVLNRAGGSPVGLPSSNGRR
ncbi:MAG: hypothetical protein AAGF92_08215 [Myxococcota bacterium]